MAKPWRCGLRLHRWQRLRGPDGSRYRECLGFGWPLEQRPGPVVGEHDGADIGEALAQVVVLEHLRWVTRLRGGG
jgi:hypothetical protein